MRVVKPIAITNAKFTSSSIAEPDVSVGEIEWVAGSYNTSDRRIKSSTHRVYEVTASPSTTDDPEVGVLADPPSWVNVGPVNKWALFDNLNSTKSKRSTQLILEVTPAEIANSVAGFSIEGAGAINVKMTDPSSGIVYDNDLDLVDNSQVANWYHYYFEPVIRVSQFALLDLPTYPSATIKVTIDGGDIAVGSLIIGGVIDLGIANYGTSVQLLDFSKKDRDEFGNVIVKEGRTSKLVDFDVTVPKEKVNYVFNQLSQITTIPSVWVGDDGSNDPTLVFGYYRNYQNNIDTPTITSATIQVEGL